MMTFQRALYFLLLYAGIFAINILTQNWQLKIFVKILLAANIFLIIISIITYVFSNQLYVWTDGGYWSGFKSLYGHSNVYASALLFTLVGVMPYFLERESQNILQKYNHGIMNKIGTLFYPSVLVGLNIFFILISYSRNSIVSLGFGTFIFLLAQKYFKLVYSILILLFIITTIYFSNESFRNTLLQYLEKGSGNFFAHRTVLFEPSLEAAKLGGIFGLGLGVSAPNIRVERPYQVDEPEIFIREKGNSTLAIIEETGLIGLILFLIPVLLIFKNISVMNLNFNQFLFLPIFATLLLHSQFESWWVWVGSPELQIYLLIMLKNFKVH